MSLIVGFIILTVVSRFYNIQLVYVISKISVIPVICVCALKRHLLFAADDNFKFCRNFKINK